jgi:hypothetical protein
LATFGRLRCEHCAARLICSRKNEVVVGVQRYILDRNLTPGDMTACPQFYYSYAAQQIQRPPIRCVVFGESNQSVEAAHELGMKCVVVTGASGWR